MAFKIYLYNINAEKNRVVKVDDTTPYLEIEGVLKEGTSLISPSILIQFNTTLGAPIYNYCYIPQFERYYFINDIVTETNNLWRLDMGVDVLMSFKDNILDLDCVISRQENMYNTDIYDDQLEVRNEKEVIVNSYYVGLFDETNLNPNSYTYLVTTVITKNLR